MLKYVETKILKEIFYDAKKLINIRDINANNTVISKLVETRTNSKYLIEYLDKVIRPLFLILPKQIEYVKTFKIKNNKLMSLHMDDERISEKIKKHLE